MENLGNFLTKEKLNKNKYERNKPKITFIINLFIIFFFCGLILEIGSIIYFTTKYTIPENTAIKTQYAEAQALNNELKASIDNYKSIKNTGIKSIEILNIVSQNKTDGINIKAIDLTKKKIMIRGTTNNIEIASKYSEKLNFPHYQKPILEKINGMTNETEFIITANYIETEQKK